MHRIFVAVHLDRFLIRIILIGIIGIAARVRRPHVPFSLTLNYPFGQHFAGTAPLSNSKGKDTCFEGIRDTGHGSQQGQPVGCIGDRTIDHAPDPGGAQYRYPRHRVFDIPFKAFQVVGV